MELPSIIVDLGNEQTVRRLVAVAVAVAVAVLVAYCRHSTVWIEPSSVDRLVDMRWFVTSRVENKGD